MRYEHDNDLRDDYPLPMVLDVLKNPFYRDSWHDRAESGNFLNKLGHGAIRRALATKSGIADAELGGLGSMIYEIATMPEFTLADEVEEPTYQDVGGMRVAMESAFLLENYDPVELLTTSFEVVKVLEEETPVLSRLAPA
ncbi:hypothetical protein B7Y94_03425 [Candidatus Saccharibacteria bacterium 32-49-12]|nr:MAG: hypothetical protein B7Y94_03425 [Candidatus Saccharibacteria bacterium 32-49-12]